MKYDRDMKYRCRKRKPTFNKQKARQFCCRVNCCHLEVKPRRPNELIQIALSETDSPATEAA